MEGNIDQRKVGLCMEVTQSESKEQIECFCGWPDLPCIHVNKCLKNEKDMEIIPLKVSDAMAWLKTNERHYKSEATPIFAIGLKMNGELVGCLVAGETNGEAEICHIYSVGEYLGYTTLYGSFVRCVKAMGYRKLIL